MKTPLTIGKTYQAKNGRSVIYLAPQDCHLAKTHGFFRAAKTPDTFFGLQFSEVKTEVETLKATENFRIVARPSNRGARLYIECLRVNHHPKSVRIGRKDADYLTQAGPSFDDACVMDFGCGVFQGKASR